LKLRAPLQAAALHGDRQEVERLLEQGANPDIQDHWGETALHKAINGRRPEIAACLLFYGANPKISDRKGRTPLSLEYTTLEMLHAIRQRYRRFRPNSSLTRIPESEEVRNWVEGLEQNGIIRISGLISPDVLLRLRAGFEAFVKRVDDRVRVGKGQYEHYDQEEYWWDSERAYVCNNAFRDSPDLVRLCCHKLLVESVNYYYGRRAYVSRTNAMRYFPHPARAIEMFDWHHDMEEKRLKAMILLTDVGEHDQTMSYVLGSHALYHPYRMFQQNKCSLDYCRKNLGSFQIFDTIGKAGDMFLFDSNGAHRGNRKADAAIRDAIFVEYTVDRSDIWGCDIPAGIFDGDALADETNPLAWILQVKPKWKNPLTRKLPTWVENLPNIEKWL
jgi:hypothetical protein